MPDATAVPSTSTSRLGLFAMALVSLALFGNFYVYDSIGPVADLLQRQRGFSDTQIGMLNAIYSLPNVVLILVGGVLVDRFGADRIIEKDDHVAFASILRSGVEGRPVSASLR